MGAAVVVVVDAVDFALEPEVVVAVDFDLAAAVVVDAVDFALEPEVVVAVDCDLEVGVVTAVVVVAAVVVVVVTIGALYLGFGKPKTVELKTSPL